jgi:hypothetical protein
MSTPSHPIRLIGGHDLQRSRLTVFFRLFLVIPHVIVLAFYAIGVFFAEIIAWFAALFTGHVPVSLHDFMDGYLRYSTRVLAYAHLLADPFPPFGSGGSYPVDVEVAPPTSQNRLTVFFRGLLALPCLIVLYPLQIALNLVAIGNWFVALITGGVPGGLQSLGMFCLRFQTRTNAYLLLLTPRYPAFGDTPASLPSDQAALPPLP